MRGVVCVEQLRAQFVAIVDVNIKTGCPEGLGPVVHGPSTKQTIFYCCEASSKKIVVFYDLYT